MAKGKPVFRFRLPWRLKTSARPPKPQNLSSNHQTGDEPATSSSDRNPHFGPPRLDLTPVSPPLAEVPLLPLSTSASDTESEKLELGAREGSPSVGMEIENPLNSPNQMTNELGFLPVTSSSTSTMDLDIPTPAREGSPRVGMGNENPLNSPNQMTNELETSPVMSPSASTRDLESPVPLGEGSPMGGTGTENPSTMELGSTVPTREGSPRVEMGMKNPPNSPNQRTNELDFVLSSSTSTADLNSPVPTREGFPWVGMRDENPLNSPNQMTNELGFSPVMSPSTSTTDLESSPVMSPSTSPTYLESSPLMSPSTSTTDLESSPVMSPSTSTTDLESSPVMSPSTSTTDLDTPVPTKNYNPHVRDQGKIKHKTDDGTERSGEELATSSLGSKVPINFKGNQTEAMTLLLWNMVNTRELDSYKPNRYNGDRARVVKDMEEEIRKFVQRLKHPKKDKLGSFITVIGENIGASMLLGGENIGASMLLGTDGDFETSKRCINSTIQGIDSSTEFNTSGLEKSKILILGGTGYIGKFIVPASAKAGHYTFVLVRESSLSDPAKAKIVENFKSLGVTILHGDVNDHGSLVKAIKEVDVVISAVGSLQILDQAKIIAAIKEAGNVKRFLPSEFGSDVDRTNAVEPAKSAFAAKAQIRRAIEAEGIPYTYVSSNCFAGYFLPTLAQPGLFTPPPPRDKLVIFGDGNVKVVFNEEHDIGTYTIRAVDDPRTLNKILYIRPPKNTYTFNELVSLWEKKIGKSIEKTYVPEEQLLKQIQESPIPINVILSINHAVFVKGDQTNFKIEPSFGVEASELYPDVKYTSVEEYLDQFV